MPVFYYDPPDRFVAGSVGQPGDRTFYLQASSTGRVTSVALEKFQVSLLAERIDELLDEVLRRPELRVEFALRRGEITRLLEDHPNIPVLIDEAYVDFGGESTVPLIAHHPNLLVVQTMSKSRGLAGLRVGYALGDVGLIEIPPPRYNVFVAYSVAPRTPNPPGL